MSEKKAEAKSDFEALLGEIGDLHKAMPADDTAKDDAKIEAAAEDGAEESDDAGDEGGEADGDKGGKEVAKSFKLKLEDGTEVDAMDGSELIKSLTERVENFEKGSATALRQVLDIVKSQAGEIAKLRGAGKGRKAVVTVAEKKPAGDDVNKSESDGVKPADFLAKSMQAFTAGKITGHDVRLAEIAVNQGKPVPAHIVRAVLA